MRKKIVMILVLSFSMLILLAKWPASASANTIVVNCGAWWSTIPIKTGASVETWIAGYEIGGRIDQATVNYGDGYSNTVTSTNYNGCGNMYQTPDIEAHWFHSYTVAGTYNITATLTDSVNHLTSVTSEGTVTVIASQINSTALSGKAGIKV